MTPEDIILRVAEAVTSAVNVQDHASRWILFRLWTVVTTPFPERVKSYFLDRLVREAAELVQRQAGSTSSLATLHATMACCWMLDWCDNGFGEVEAEIILHHCKSCADVVSGPRVINSTVN